MLARFFSVSLFALTSSLMGVSCNRAPEANDTPSSSLPASSPSVPDPTRQWDDLLSGHPEVSADVRGALRRGADEEALASNPRTPLEEGVPATVSRARHQRYALAHYETALGGLGEEPSEVRRRVRGKIETLRLSIQSLDGLNGRLFGQEPR